MKVNFFWFRRDLRLEDNKGLLAALKSGLPVIPIFIFDINILEELPSDDARVTFIHREVSKLYGRITGLGGHMVVKFGDPLKIWKAISENYDIDTVYFNRDYEPYAKDRDKEIYSLLNSKGIRFEGHKDHVIFEGDEVLKADGTPYTVFTPFSRKWKAKLDEPEINALANYDCAQYLDAFKLNLKSTQLLSLEDIGFQSSKLAFPSSTVKSGIIKNYDKTRDYPAIEGTSRLGIHYRFGTISIREKLRKALKLNGTYVNELIWRDFYSMILQNFPHVVSEPFRSKYLNIEWRNNKAEFQAWCEGQTGYPLVDAGMRELNQTGYMHNRVRMVVASFLTKHLLVDWRWGEAYFARKLLDFELASNNGGWQWAAGCGTDAAPYFRIFNPTSQQKKFDPKLEYIKKYIPELDTPRYPAPIVDHKMARERCLATYKTALTEK